MSREVSTRIARVARRLELTGPLTPEDRHLLESAVTSPQRFGARDTIVKQSARLDRVAVVLEGFACCYNLLPDGRRQISAFMLPGDICDLRNLARARLDHTIAALSPVEAAFITRENAARLEASPTLMRAIACGALVQQSILRQWLVNVAQRTAFERLSHLLCEIFERLKMTGLTTDFSCELPLTQLDIADTLALSAVHVNRTLMELRRSGLILFRSRQLIIHDYATLRRVAGFEPAYLSVNDPASIESGSNIPSNRTNLNLA